MLSSELTEAMKIASETIMDRPQDALTKVAQIMGHPMVEAYIEHYQKTRRENRKEQLLTMFAIGVLVGEEIEK